MSVPTLIDLPDAGPTSYQSNPDVAYWTFAIYSMVVVIVSLFYLFYMNRGMALVLTWIINFYTWRQHNEWVEVESIAFAPLSGKILFKNLKYYSRDQSISILRGHITFRYWVFRVRKEAPSPDQQAALAELPCRIKIRIDGLEWFLYNRTSAYEQLKNLFESMTDGDSLNSPSHQNSPFRDTASVHILPDGGEITQHPAKDSLLRALLPLELVSTTGSAMIGNPDLQTILTASYQEAKGVYEIVKPRSPYDTYSSNLTLKLHQTKLKMQLNADFKESELNQAARMREFHPESQLFKGIPFLERLAAYFNKLSSMQHPDMDDSIPLQNASTWGHWSGLSRYTNPQPAHNIYNGVISHDEYARVLRIMDCDEFTLNYYYDCPGPVPARSMKARAFDVDIGNGDLPPQWGIDLLANNASLFYGPWTDRQRSHLQHFFYPPSYTNQEPARILGANDLRVHTVFKILLQFTGNSSWQIPLREASKDYLFADSLRSPSEGGNNARKKRHYGWFDLKFSTGSTVSYTLPLINSENGSTSEAIVSLRDLVVISSLNHAEVVVADRLTLNCALHHPLIWNASRVWKFDVIISNHMLEPLRSPSPDARTSTVNVPGIIKGVYLLRDHITLLQDLITDWGSGPPVTLDKHIPIQYQLKVLFSEFRLFLCVNPLNVINQPNDLEENAYMVVQGTELKANILMDFTLFNTDTVSIPVEVEARKLAVHMAFPPTNTIGAYLTEEAAQFGSIEKLTIPLTYRYHRDPESPKVDSLTLTVSANSVNMTLFGFHLRYLLYLQDNYFGEHISFQTVSEYNAGLKSPQPSQRSDKLTTRPFEIQLQLFVTDDMEMTVSPIILTRSLGSGDSLDENSATGSDPTANDFLHLQDIHIRKHSLLGPSPAFAVYLSDWRFDIGAITGELQPSSMPGGFSSGSTFLFHLRDTENSISTPASLPDVTLLELNLSTVNLRMWSQDSTMRCLLSGSRVLYDTLACNRWISRTVVELPEVAIRSHVVTGAGSAYEREWVEVLAFETAASIGIFNSIPKGVECYQTQQQFLSDQDVYTRRVPFLYSKGKESPSSTKARKKSFTLFVPPYNPPTSFRLGTEESVDDRESSLGGGSVIKRRDDREDISYHTASDRTSENNSPQPVDEASPTSNNESYIEGSQDPEMPVSRSIPYRDYLRRWRMLKPLATGIPHALQAYLGPSLTQFDPLNSQSERLYERVTSRTVPKLLPAFKSLRSKFESGETGNEKGALDPADEQTAHQAITIDVPEKLSILVTPMFLKLVEEVLEQLTTKDVILETLLDRFQLSYMSEIIQKYPYDFDSSAVLVTVPKVDILCIQDMQLPDSTTFLTDDGNINLRTRYELSDAVLCSFDIDLDDLMFQFFLRHENPKVNRSGISSLKEPKLVEFKFMIECSAFHLILRFMGTMNAIGIMGIPQEKRPVRRSPVAGEHSNGLEAAPVVLDIYSDKVEWRGVVNRTVGDSPKGASVEFSMQSLSIVTIDQTVEIMFGSITTWLNFVVDIATLLTEFSNKRRRQIQLLVARIVELSRVRPLPPPGDPKFLTNRSVLWNLVSRPFQNTSGWKILAHIRYCLKVLSVDLASSPNNVLGGDQEQTASQLFESVVANLSGWRKGEIGEFQLRQSPLLQGLYGELGAVLAKDQAYKPLDADFYNNHISLHCESFRVTIVEHHTENSIEILSVHADVRTFLNEISALPSTTDENEQRPQFGKRKSAVASLSSHYLDVVGHAGIDSIVFDINPNMFGFIRHALRVYSWFQTKLVAEAIPGLPPLPITPGTGRRPVRASTRTSTMLKDMELAPKEPSTSDLSELLPAGLLIVLTVTGGVRMIQANAKAHLLEMKAHIMGIQLSTIHRGKLRSAISMMGGSASNRNTQLDPVVNSRHVFEELVHSSVGRIDYIVLRISERVQPLLTFDIRKVSTTVTIARGFPMPDGMKPPKTLKVGCMIGSVAFTLPRSLLKLHAFLEKWGDEDLPRYDFLFNKMVEELTPIVHNPQSKAYEVVEGIFEQAASRIATVDLQVAVQRVDIQCDLLNSLRLNYIGTEWLLVLNRQERLEGQLLGPQERHISMNYVLRLGKQDIAFETSVVDEDQVSYSKPVFTIPAITGRGSITFGILSDDSSIFRNSPSDRPSRRLSTFLESDDPQPILHSNVIRPRIITTIYMEKVTATLNVSMIDQLTTAQSIFGHELNDLFEVIIFYRQGKDRNATASPSHPSWVSRLGFDIDATVESISILAESPETVIVYDSKELKGTFRNIEDSTFRNDNVDELLDWNVEASLVRFSLCQRTPVVEVEPRTSLAFFEMGDLKVQNMPSLVRGHAPSEIVMSSKGIRSYLPPNALARVINFWRYYAAELVKKGAMKTDEIRTWRAHTKLLLDSINVPVPEYTKAAKSYFSHRQITLELSNVGLAVPLTTDDSDSLSPQLASSQETMPTFLWSISKIQLRLHEWKSAASVIENFCIQLVPWFNQNDSKQYTCRPHPLQNRLLLKKMEARLLPVASDDGSTHELVNGDVSGFELEVDADIADYANRLLEVYQKSRGIVLMFMAPSSVRVSEEVLEHSTILSRGIELDIEAHFKFESGLCKIHTTRRSEVDPKRRMSVISQDRRASRAERPTNRKRATGLEKEIPVERSFHDFIMPGVTVGVRGRTKPNEPSTGGLHFEVRIHPSQNSIAPNILDFAHDVLEQIRLGRLARMTSPSEAALPQVYSRSDSTTSRAVSSVVPRFSVTVHLVLSETVVNLTCEPNVVCGFTVQEANMLVSYIPRQHLHKQYQFVCCHGFVLGISGGLRNKYSPEDCVKSEVKQINLGVTMVEENHNRTYTMEADVPSVRLDLNVRHLQDFFLFERTWFGHFASQKTRSSSLGSMYTAGNNAPIFSDDIPASQRPSRSLVQLARIAAAKTVNYRDSARIAGRIAKIEIVADLGQAIGRATFVLDDLAGSTSGVWTSNIFESRSLVVGFHELTLNAQGRTAGSVQVTNVRLLGWATNPWDATPDTILGKRRATDLNVKIERIVSQVEYQHERILILEVLPISGTIVDEWTIGGNEVPTTNINMHFKVDQVRAIVSRRTLPVFSQTYSKLLNLISDKRRADRHMGTRVEPQMDNGRHATVLVLEGMPSRVVTTLSIVLGDAFVTMTRYNFRDPDCAQVLASMVKIGFVHEPNVSTDVRNSTRLELFSFAIRKCTARAITPNLERTLALKEWFTFFTSSGAKNVVRVPSSVMELIVEGPPGAPRLGYSFKTDFSGQIDVALNFGLYRYLQELAGLYSKASQVSGDGGYELDDGSDSASIITENMRASPVNGSSSAGSSDGGRSNRVGSSTGAAARRESIEWVRTGEFKFEPQLKVTGDATPWEWIEWLGVHKDEVPKLVHSGLSQPLNSALLLLGSLYNTVHVLPISRPERPVEREIEDEFLDALE
ncbi:hypothetical protein SmJEL517_g02685 [Synchytrium microbalum]|uniref:Csf1 N-terminal domain-containing protein n=1 Tax=Synchytrium microbalum TaxID=1806994 RepID=A0A507C9I2_9FUNG|nr:uncharacterized protein SmJEL517_g02685 [Synchytrium microbalum]TPX34646.1 hypothetical protein SmJEL517_g02685 [Synchytrium microbalum]